MSNWFTKQLSKLGLGKDTVAMAEAVPELAEQELTLLLVDDAPENLRMLSETLRPTGHKLVVAKDGNAALAAARRNPPALVLLDIQMPGMDGFEVCQKLKQDPELQQAAVIFCSSLEDTGSKVKGLQLGAVDFITKPFEPEEVLARVATHLTVQRLAVSLQRQNRALQHELAVAREHQKQAVERTSWALLGKSPALQKLRNEIATCTMPVVLLGPGACGEEAVAREIHGSDSNHAFIPVDASSLSEAEEARVLDAKVALAGPEGTVYVERAELLSPASWERLSKERVIASSTKVLSTPSFWEAKAPPITIRIPTLAERAEDIPELAAAILLREARRLGKTAKKLDDESVARLKAYNWPRNLRELEEVIRRALATSSGETVSLDERLLQSGTPLGSYRLLDKLDDSGAGEVWKARHDLLLRPAAVKVSRAKKTTPEEIERFRQDAMAVAQLTCPHTVSLLDFGVGESGEPYYVMEFLEGLNLQRMLSKAGSLAPPRVAHLLVGVCKSLAEAHALGLLHGDLKPSSLVMARVGMELDYVKVLGYGHTPDVSPEYAPPEKTPASDGRSDMYSLGATAYHLLVGVAVPENDPRLPISAGVPEPLQSLVHRCLSHTVEERPTATEMWTALASSSLPGEWTQRNALNWWNKHVLSQGS